MQKWSENSTQRRKYRHATDSTTEIDGYDGVEISRGLKGTRSECSFK